jgi:hypothetical protein
MMFVGGRCGLSVSPGRVMVRAAPGSTIAVTMHWYLPFPRISGLRGETRNPLGEWGAQTTVEDPQGGWAVALKLDANGPFVPPEPKEGPAHLRRGKAVVVVALTLWSQRFQGGSTGGGGWGPIPRIGEGLDCRGVRLGGRVRGGG